MQTYLEHKQSKQEAVNNFPMFFAIDNKGFEKGLEQINATKEDKLVHIGGGGIIKKDDLEDFENMFETYRQQHHANILESEDYVYHMVKYELANHEFMITYELDDTLESCELTDELLANPIVKATVNKAVKDFKLENEM